MLRLVSVTDLALRDGILDFVDLDLTEAFDLQQVATRRRMHRSDRVVAIGLEFCDVDSTDAVRLNGIDVDDEAVLSGESAHVVGCGSCGHVRRCLNRHSRLKMVPW